MDIINTIQKTGKDFCSFLDNRSIILTPNQDGRLESLNSEGSVTDALREGFPDVPFLPKEENRSFGDIDIQYDESVFPPTEQQLNFPINIKIVSETTQTYNAGGVKLFHYSLYGGGEIGFTALARKIRKNPPTKLAREYSYLTYYKNSKKKPDFFFLSDVSRESITTNPSNPLQLRQNIVLVDRTPEEKLRFILDLFEEVCYKRALPYLKLAGLEK